MKKTLTLLLLLCSSVSFGFFEEGTNDAVLVEECILVDSNEGLKPQCEKIKQGEINQIQVNRTPFEEAKNPGDKSSSVMVLYGSNANGDRAYSLSSAVEIDYLLSRNRKVEITESRGASLTYTDTNTNRQKKFQVLSNYIIEVSAGRKQAAVSVYGRLGAGFNFDYIEQPIYKYVDFAAAAGAKVRIWKVQGIVENAVSIQGHNMVKMGIGINLGNGLRK